MSEKLEPMQPRYYRSPVDYEAWRNGYMPPTEHVLIHKLSVGEVKVIAMSDYGKDAGGWWLVVKGGKRLTAAQRKAMRYLMETMEEIEADEDMVASTVGAPPEPDEEPPPPDESQATA